MAAVSNRKPFWVVVADEAEAILYGRETRSGPLVEMDRLRNDDARRKTGELLADRGGRAFDSHGHGRHTMTRERSGPQQHAADVFAKSVAERIAAGLHAGQCRAYALVAAPRFLGTLRRALGLVTKEEPYASLAKQVTSKDPAAIGDMLDAS